MEMFYLILAFSNRELSMTALPQPYPKEQCESIKEDWKKTSNSKQAFCIPIPNDSEYFNCSTIIADPRNQGVGMVAKIHCDLKTDK